jgi:hypothetical protein
MIGLALAAWPAAAGAPAASDRQLKERAGALASSLDDDRYEVRRRAADTVQELLADPASAAIVASELRRLLGQPDLSFEVRKQLETWLKTAPASPDDRGAEPPEASQEELNALIVQLDDASYARRLGASRRLQELAGHPTTAIPLAFLLREQLADPRLSRDAYRTFCSLWESARGTWLLSDPASWKLPEVSDRQIEEALATIVKSAPEDHQGAWHEHTVARRELFDFLARDQAAPRVKRALEAELAKEDLDAAARERLDEIHEWTTPALVAEIWKGREHIAIQHLHVDVPRQSLGAPRPSHFSRIDDRTAYCVSGSNLVPGAYPVGVAIPHPAGNPEDWMCHLVNLPNPRRRMAYQYAVRVDQRQRLAAITERTFRRATGEKQHLTDLQINGLVELDPATVSRLAPQYLMSIDDQAMEASGKNLGGIQATHHQRICYVLAGLGTKEAGPGLVQVLKDSRCLPPSPETAHYHWPAIAALCIAARDPWPEAQTWLASQITSQEPLFIGRDESDESHVDPASKQNPSAAATPPVLGASAAAVLLERHKLSPDSFGLVKVEVAALNGFKCPSFRFASTDRPLRLLSWWQQSEHQRGQKGQMP